MIASFLRQLMISFMPARRCHRLICLHSQLLMKNKFSRKQFQGPSATSFKIIQKPSPASSESENSREAQVHFLPTQGWG